VVTEQELSVKFAAVEDSELGVVEVGNAGQRKVVVTAVTRHSSTPQEPGAEMGVSHLCSLLLLLCHCYSSFPSKLLIL
jgi:hypothetical protein